MPDRQRSISAQRSEPDDDIDKLFSRLELLEPPADLVKRILHSIPQRSPRPENPEPQWDSDSHIDGLVVRNENKEPS
jgi:hypothetical protein